MSYIVLDTDVTSRSFKQQLPPSLFARLAGRPTCITFVTFGELTQWGIIRHWGKPRRAALAQRLAHMPILPGDRSERITSRAHEFRVSLPVRTVEARQLDDALTALYQREDG
jgi:predicted nucleic acid-binding protein